MSLHLYDDTSFQGNLASSALFLNGKNLNNYWLNRDGTITPKTSWLGRLIRWFQNFFFNKTLNDTWQVFKRAVKDFEATRKFLSGFECSSPIVEAEANVVLTARRERLKFVVKFLLSRKDRFDDWVKENPEKLKVLKTCIEKYRVCVENQIKSLQTDKEDSEINLDPPISKLKKKIITENAAGLNKLLNYLETVYLPSVNKEMLCKKPPPLTICVSPEINDSEYSTLELGELLDYYDEIPLTPKVQSIFNNFLSLIQNGTFEKEVGLQITLLMKKIGLPDTEVTSDGASLEALKEKVNELLHSGHEPLSFGTIELFQLFNLIEKLLTDKIPESAVELKKGSSSEMTSEELAKNKEELAVVILKQALAVIGKNTGDGMDYTLLSKLFYRRKNLANLIQKVKIRDEKVFGVNAAIHEKYYSQIELFLKNILHAIKSNEKIPKSKKESVLREIANAAGECGARWIEETKKQYRSLTLLGISSLEASILEHIQAFKEDLYLELFQNIANGVEYHILDSFRKEYGEELGLDDSTVDLDIFTYPIDKKFLELIKKVFLHVYTAPRLVKGLKERINLQLQDAFEPEYFTYLSECVEKRYPKVEDPSVYVMDHFMGSDYKTINEDGVLFILKELKFLKR